MSAVTRTAAETLLAFLDARLAALGGQGGGGPPLPDEAVVLRALTQRRGGGSGFSVARPPGQETIHHGVLDADVEFLLWERSLAAAASRARALLLAVVALEDTPLAPAETSPGQVRAARDVGADRPTLVTPPSSWLVGVRARIEYEYRITSAPGEGVIESVEVALPDQITESFTVGAS
ncbi:MAG: hypothetical protein H6983_23915 [Ectothiorhodospiraceae bacterium]|nr:hypothetical protein [Chromatiales bacterium]MCP5157245.1 hypothetical protein [Ectothiorhodospiraceae bacterium]